MNNNYIQNYIRTEVISSGERGLGQAIIEDAREGGLYSRTTTLHSGTMSAMPTGRAGYGNS